MKKTRNPIDTNVLPHVTVFPKKLRWESIFSGRVSFYPGQIADTLPSLIAPRACKTHAMSLAFLNQAAFPGKLLCGAFCGVLSCRSLGNHFSIDTFSCRFSCFAAAGGWIVRSNESHANR